MDLRPHHLLWCAAAASGQSFAKIRRYKDFTKKAKKLVSMGKPHKYQLFQKRETGFEPATLALARRYSTTEPLARLIFSRFSTGKK